MIIYSGALIATARVGNAQQAMGFNRTSAHPSEMHATVSVFIVRVSHGAFYPQLAAIFGTGKFSFRAASDAFIDARTVRSSSQVHAGVVLARAL